MTQTEATDIAVRDDQTAITRADAQEAAKALEHILATGDLSKLTAEGRVATYLDLCSSLSLNPRSRPFDWLILDGKLILYPNKSCAEQLRRQHQISIRVTRRDVIGDKTKEPMFVVEVEGRRPNGQTDQASKYAPLWNSKGRLSGRDLANAYAKCETGAKRRLTFSMIGMAAPPDELESARRVIVDGTGRVIESPTDEERALADDPRLARALGVPTYEDLPSATGWAPLAGSPDQAPTLDELEPVRREAERQSFGCDKGLWSRRWAMLVKGTYLDDDDARHQHVEEYTSEWPLAARTNSLSRFLDIVTDRQAADFYALTARILADKRAAEAADPDNELEGSEGLSDEQATSEAVRQGGYEVRPAGTVVDVAAGEAAVMAHPDRPVDGETYDAMAWRNFYRAWVAELRKRDTTVKPMSDAQLVKLPLAALAQEVARVIGEVEGLDHVLAMADDDPAEAPSTDEPPADEPAF